MENQEAFMLETQHVSKHYGKLEVLKDINLQVKKGEVICLIGPSGAGKSTYLRSLNQLETITGGKIFIKGHLLLHREHDHTVERIDKKAQQQLLLEMGMCFQRFNLFPHKTVLDNVMMSPIIVKHEDKEQVRQEALTLLDRVGLKSKADEYPNRLSGGQQQRVAIARSLVNEPEVLLLDEPLGALDLKLRKEMQLELKSMQQRLGITFIFVTHDQEEALTMSDTIVVMKDGTIQQIGDPKTIYDEPANAFVADFIGESNIINGCMPRDCEVEFTGRRFECVDKGFAPNEPVDVVIRPEDIDIVKPAESHLVGTVTGITFKGLNYDIIVEFKGFKWLIQTTDYCPVDAYIGIRLNPEDIHIMHKSEYSGLYGDYSSYSAEYDEIADASEEEADEE